MIKVVVDAFGGDRSPDANVKGAIEAVNEIKDLHVIFTGDENILNSKLSEYSYDKERVTIIHAPEVIGCDEQPTVAIKNKKNSSMCVAYDLLKNDESVGAMVSIGSSGAILAGGVLKIGRIKGVKRPAFCPILPTMEGGVFAICDSGSNVDCKAEYLNQFAIMGSIYMKKAFGVENPKVALLNVGVESEKGDLLRKEVYPMLKENKHINFVGNMESRDALSGNYDLIVCDGFSGNVLIKSIEGTAIELLKKIKKVFTKSLKNKLGALILKKDVMELKDYMDYNNYGGAVLLGASKTIIKGHGGSKWNAVYNCVKQAYKIEKTKLNEEIAKAIASIEE
ncbi:MAG: phosphate acyltransferase PlsX [Clostridia bacterium]|nr:phosphate acyltransferase PlsX [Clostridia bacterium]